MSRYPIDVDVAEQGWRETIFTATVQREDPAVVRLCGELDLAGVPRLLSALEQLDGDVHVDCSGVAFIDAAGLGAFVRAHQACAARGARLVVVDPSPAVVRLVSLVSLDALLHLRRSSAAP